jgi:hypothetical protein
VTRRVKACVFAADPTVPADSQGRRYCTCGALEQHERHSLPLMTEEQHDVEARRLGERQGDPA